jgi:dTDP-6-deoxy-L-talose 4-dehydrogenase (NAD+)
MKILVTGATGFIGRHLIPELINRGHEIIAAGLEDKNNLQFPWLDKVRYIQYDLNESNDNCYDRLQRPDRLIHLCWAGLPNYQELFHLEKNLFNSYFFIKQLVLSGVKDITVLGTCFEYGLQEGCLSEEMATRPVNPYGLAKDCLRKFLQELNIKQPFNLKWVRLFYLYGAGQNKNSILELLKKALENNDAVFNMSGGEQQRDYLPVEKAAEYIAKIALKDDFSGIVNCCSGNPVSIRSLVENYLQDNHKSIKLNLGYYPYPDYEPMAFWGNNDKLQKIVKA